MSHDCRGDLDPQTVLSCKLYGRRRLRLKVLGSVKKTLGELFEGSSTSACVHLFALINIHFPIGADIQLYDGTSEIAVLKIYGSNNAREFMDELVPSTKKPSEYHKFLESSETLGKVFDAAKGMIDTLSGVGNMLRFDIYWLTRAFSQGAPGSYRRLGTSVCWV